MGAFTDRLRDSSHKLLWLDYTDYGGRLLAGGKVPWLDVSAFLGWQRKAQALLRSDVIQIQLGRLIAVWLASHEAERAALAARRRATYPLRTLLAGSSLRAHILELTHGIRANFVDLPLALVCPSPREWISESFRHAFGAEASVEVGEDEVDSASLYIADFLRILGDAGLDVLLLEESATSEPQSIADLSCYQAVFNVGAHYRWDVGLRVSGTRFEGGGSSVAFVIAPGVVPATRVGISIIPAFWAGNTTAAPDCPADGFRYSSIPREAAPELVLERVALLR